MYDLDTAERGLRKALADNDPRVHPGMLSAIIAVQQRGGRTDHIFEENAISTGIFLAEEHPEV